MPIRKEDILDYLENNEIQYISTHHRLCLPIINRIYKKMKNGIRFESIKIDKDLIIDGHHRYVSSLLAGITIDTVMSSKTSATIAHEWSTVEFIEEEWDTLDKIKYLNELDAEYNNMPLEKIIEITK